MTHTAPALGKTAPRSAFRRTALLLVPLFLAGCGDSEIVAYRVPKSAAAPAPSPASETAAVENPHAAPMTAAPNTPPPMGGGAVPNATFATAEGPSLTWTPLAGWQPKTGSATRKGSYAIAGEGGATADLAITAFPGDVGGEVANVNRWRGQVQLAPLSDSDAAAALARLDVNGLKIAILDVASAEGADRVRMIGAMIPFGGSTWFFKLLGPDALVAAQKPAFLEFLKTVKPAAPTP